MAKKLKLDYTSHWERLAKAELSEGVIFDNIPDVEIISVAHIVGSYLLTFFDQMKLTWTIIKTKNKKLSPYLTEITTNSKVSNGMTLTSVVLMDFVGQYVGTDITLKYNGREQRIAYTDKELRDQGFNTFFDKVIADLTLALRNLFGLDEIT